MVELTQDLPRVFQHWQPVGTAGEFSFAAGAPFEEEASVWRLELPGDPAAASAILRATEAQVSAAQQALDIAPRRLNHFVQGLRNTASGGISFDSEAVQPLPPAESELLHWLGSAGPGEAQFDVEEPSQAEAKRDGLQVQQALERLLQQVLNFAWVETRQDGRLLARSVVDWGGDTDTVWGVVLPGEASLHRRSLALAVVSRAALLRLVVTIAQGAAKISLLLGTPGTTVLALPAAWKYVNRIISEVESYKTSTSRI